MANGDNQEPLRAILDRATAEQNERTVKKAPQLPLSPPPTHNQEDIGDRFSLLTDKLCEYRLEVAKQLVVKAENHLKQVEAEVQETRIAAKRKWEEYQALMRMLEDVTSESMAVGRKLQNGMDKK
jgi:hypothetical protein